MLTCDISVLLDHVTRPHRHGQTGFNLTSPEFYLCLSTPPCH